MNTFNESKFDEERMYIYQIFAESAFDIMYENDREDEILNDDTYMEGANLEIRAFLKELKKEYQKRFRDIKMSRAACDYEKALKAVNELKELTNKYIRAIELTKSTVGSFVFGLFTSFSVNFLRNLGLTLLSPFTFCISGLVAKIMNLYEAYGRPIGKLANHEDIHIVDDFNLYKNIVLSNANKIKKLVIKLEKAVKEEAEEYKATGAVRTLKVKPPKFKKINFKKESVDEVLNERIYNTLSELREFEGGD